MSPQDEQSVEPEVPVEPQVQNAIPEPASAPAPTSAPTLTPAPKQPSRGKTIAKSLLGALGVLVVFVVAEIIGTIAGITFLFIVKGYSTLSLETVNTIMTENLGFMNLACQAFEFVALIIFWLIVRRRSVMRAKVAYVSYAGNPSAVAKRIVAVLLMGLALQFCISGALSTLAYLFPAISAVYEDLANLLNDSLGGFFGEVSAVIGAPLVEELLVRGLFFEFMLRIFQSDFVQWREKAYPQKGCKPQLAPSTTMAAFWIANILQALMFGIIHLNLIQVADPDNLDEPVRYYIDMLKQIHATEVEPGELPNLNQQVLGWTDFVKDELTPESAAKLHALVEALPERNTLLHGDYHTNNVMVQNGEALLIDMDTLAVGHPIIESGSMFNAFKGFADLDHSVTEEFFGYSYEVASRFWYLSLARYLGTDDQETIQAVENKAKIIGYTRLLRRSMRRQESNRDELIANYKQHLEELLPQIDTLEF